MLQLPLPQHLHPFFFDIVEHIDPVKDVDCISPENYSKMSSYESNQSLIQYLSENKDTISRSFEYFHGSRKIFPCTALSIDQMIFKYGIDCAGKVVVILGKSYLVGTPINSLFESKGATVQICTQKTKNQDLIIEQADILVSCTGNNITLNPEKVKQGLVLFDVGIGIDSETGLIRGDIQIEPIAHKLGLYTPVPGGLGPLTVANMIHNLYLSFLTQKVY